MQRCSNSPRVIKLHVRSNMHQLWGSISPDPANESAPPPEGAQPATPARADPSVSPGPPPCTISLFAQIARQQLKEFIEKQNCKKPIHTSSLQAIVKLDLRGPAQRPKAVDGDVIAYIVDGAILYVQNELQRTADQHTRCFTSHAGRASVPSSLCQTGQTGGSMSWQSPSWRSRNQCRCCKWSLVTEST